MILFITEQPYTYNLRGGAALSSSHLRFIRRKFPEETIRVVFLNGSADFWIESPDFDTSKIQLTIIRAPKAQFRPLTLKDLPLFCTSRLATLARGLFRFPDELERALIELGDLIKGEKDIRFILCEHLMPVLYLASLLPEELFGDKVVYSHHDFMFKILRIRSNSLKRLMRSWLVRRLEMCVFRKLRHFVSGSCFELEQIRKLAPQASNLELLPCFYPTLQSKGLRPGSPVVKIYHVGSVAATANKIGIKFFLSKVFPAIEHLPFSLEFVGNVQGYILQEFPQLKDHPKVVLHGFVPDLEQKIEEGMIHIIPYSGMTGTRTRVAGIARFKPCLLGFKTIQDSYPFLVAGENAMIASTDEDFVAKLKVLITDEALRRKISSRVLGDMTQFENRLLSEVTMTGRQRGQG